MSSFFGRHDCCDYDCARCARTMADEGGGGRRRRVLQAGDAVCEVRVLWVLYIIRGGRSFSRFFSGHQSVSLSVLSSLLSSLSFSRYFLSSASARFCSVCCFLFLSIILVLYSLLRFHTHPPLSAGCSGVHDTIHTPDEFLLLLSLIYITDILSRAIAYTPPHFYYSTIPLLASLPLRERHAKEQYLLYTQFSILNSQFSTQCNSCSS